MKIQSVPMSWQNTLKAALEKSFTKDAVFILFLLLAGSKYLYNFQSIIDIKLYDEASYMRSGLSLPNGLPQPDYAPLYAVWYYLLSLLQPDRIQLYYLNYILVTILPVILLYAVLRRYGVNQIVSVLISAFFLVSYQNLIVWPKVGHFALILVLISLFVGSYFGSRIRMLIYSVGALITSYVRPEFFPVFVLLGLFALWRYFRQPDIVKKSDWAWLAGIVFFALMLFGKLGFPVSNGERVKVAFGQHFSLNWTTWTHSDLNPWLNWTVIMKQNFGSTVGPLQALIVNPDMFLHHTGANLSLLLKRIAKLTFIHANFIFPVELSQVETILIALFTVAVIIIAGRTQLFFWRVKLSQNIDLLLVAGSYALISFVAAVIIFPRDHYLILPIVLIAIAASAFLSTALSNNRLNYRSLLLFGFVLFAITPQAAESYPLDKTRPIWSVVTSIRKADPKEDVELVVFDALGGICTYFNNHCRNVSPSPENTDCMEFISRNHVNIIVFTKPLRDSPVVTSALQCGDILDKPQSHGFSEVKIRGIDIEILLSDSLKK
jgi:hypothetical protein